MAADLVARKVDLIAAISPAAVRAAQAATATIPIVAGDLESDPVASGFVASIARPGGNITGVFLDFPDFSKKWLEALKEAVPQTANVAVFWDPATGPMQRQAVEAAAQTPDSDPVAVPELGAPGRLAVHGGAVLAAHVHKRPATAVPFQARVAPGDARVLQDEVTGEVASDLQALPIPYHHDPGRTVRRMQRQLGRHLGPSRGDGDPERTPMRARALPLVIRAKTKALAVGCCSVIQDPTGLARPAGRG